MKSQTTYAWRVLCVLLISVAANDHNPTTSFSDQNPQHIIDLNLQQDSLGEDLRVFYPQEKWRLSFIQMPNSGSTETTKLCGSIHCTKGSLLVDRRFTLYVINAAIQHRIQA